MRVSSTCIMICVSYVLPCWSCMPYPGAYLKPARMPTIRLATQPYHLAQSGSAGC